MVPSLKRLVLLAGVCLLLSCTDAAQDGATVKVRPRASVTGTGTGSVRCAVWVEGPAGDSLTGAVVTVRNGANQVTLLAYDAAQCAYTATVEETARDAAYTFEVSSILLDTPMTLKVPYTALTQKPGVTVFQDVSGASVLNGQGLGAGQPVQIAWTSCGEGAAYQVTVKTALTAVYSVSTNAKTVTLPAGAIPAGNYTLEIIAQKIYGDPYFKEAVYYSLSATKSAALSFHVD
jgi:hypothetical protein